MDYKHHVQKRSTPALFTQFIQFLCVWAASHTIVLLSAVLWHMCVTISPLNSCLIIPNLREYSNKAFNAFFHMILRSRDSCSAAFIAVFREGTDSSAHLIGEEVWERADSLQTFTNKNYCAADTRMLRRKQRGHCTRGGSPAFTHSHSQSVFLECNPRRLQAGQFHSTMIQF